MKKATILHVLPALDAGGVELNTLEIVAAQRDAGAEVLVASSGGRLATDLGDSHVSLPVNSKSPIELWRNSIRLGDLIAGRGVDLVHAHSRAPAWSAWAAARRARVPFVTTFHSIYSTGSAVKRAYNSIMTRGDRAIAISNFVAGHMKTTYGCSESRLRVVRYGINTEMFDPAVILAGKKASLRRYWRIGDGAKVVLLPGRFTRRKGHKILIEAMRQLRMSDANLVAVFVGSDDGHEDYRRECEEQARGLPVRFASHAADMATAYAVSDVVAIPSVRPESFGLVHAEPGAMGVPVVASDIGAAREILIPGVTGWLVPPAQPRALADGIRQALAATGPGLAATARHHIVENFARERMWKETLEVYRELLQND